MDWESLRMNVVSDWEDGPNTAAPKELLAVTFRFEGPDKTWFCLHDISTKECVSDTVEYDPPGIKEIRLTLTKPAHYVQVIGKYRTEVPGLGGTLVISPPSWSNGDFTPE